MTPELLNGQSAYGANTVALARAHGTSRNDPRVAAKEFESVFIATMLNSMSSGIEADAPFGGGAGEETWRGMMNEEIAKSVAAAGGVGISDAIYRELIALQEGASS